MNPQDKTSELPGTKRGGAPLGSPPPTTQTTVELQLQTNHLNAETVRLVAEANDICLRQLQGLKRVADWLRRDLVAEAARLAQLECDLRERETKVQHADKLYQETAQIKRLAEAQALENQCMLAEAQARKVAAEAAESQAAQAAKSHEEAAACARDEQERAKSLLAESRADREKAEAVRNEAAGHLQQAQQLLEESEKLQSQLLPAAFQTEPWRSWREELIRRAAVEGTFSLLLARLHTAAALERSRRPITMELLRDIGRSVYETCAPQAEKIAQALGQAARGQFEIKTIRVGDRVDNKFMKPAAAGLVEVRAVSGWAVRDAKGNWQFLAEVA
jgi:hypothetical protein